MIRELFVHADIRTWVHHYSAYGVRIAPLALFLLFTIANAAYLHRVPGLLGDEASEGQNVFELLTSDRITIIGERSYIGPWIDYARIPFVGLFGYSIVALRIPVFLLSLVTFWLSWFVFRRLFTIPEALSALAFALFSPAYLTYQRLGWAITLVPFFIALTLFFILQKEHGSSSLARPAPLLAGLSLGTGLATHILFLASIPPLILGWCVRQLAPVRATNHSTPLKALWLTMSDALKRGVEWWPAILGFWAGFGTQFAVLRLYTEDQGDPRVVASLFGAHLRNLRLVLMDVLSGSSYVASYTGREFSPLGIRVITGILALFVIVALVGSTRKRVAWVWLLGLGIHLLTLTSLMEHFSPRYFVVFVLGVWALAGVGAGALASRLATTVPRLTLAVPITIAVLLTAATAETTLLPFLRTGGSTAEFSVGKRTNTAAAFVDTRPLVACLRGIGPATSENVHIRNRLQYLELQVPDLNLADDTKHAAWTILYRSARMRERPDERCPTLAHFIVVPAREGPLKDPQELTQ